MKGTLPATLATRLLARGVTYAQIVSAAAHASLRWVVEISMSSDSTSPGPNVPARSGAGSGRRHRRSGRAGRRGWSDRRLPCRPAPHRGPRGGAIGYPLIATVDGRQLGRLGPSIPETAAVAKALRTTDALNLDGGGSTAMVLDGTLVSHPSDATGERPWATLSTSADAGPSRRAVTLRGHRPT